ncbi:hypothetical protein TorRG33x02_031940 [Trema orientale]|uniref:Uncharacterized protein n=1 Tax=Trema orientale TaxID=63057 RepID=A0A2P5FT97_TREOI|nr:hypothetical protein TorRG33x02_031940 [Trema orientale]
MAVLRVVRIPFKSWQAPAQVTDGAGIGASTLAIRLASEVRGRSSFSTGQITYPPIKNQRKVLLNPKMLKSFIGIGASWQHPAPEHEGPKSTSSARSHLDTRPVWNLFPQDRVSVATDGGEFVFGGGDGEFGVPQLDPGGNACVGSDAGLFVAVGR